MEKIILTIDDVDTTLAILTYTLNKKFKVVRKTNGKEALDWLHEGNLPDVIISDLQMPHMDGFEFIKHLKASGFFKDIPLLVLSNNESSNMKIKCLRSGADDYLIKPFNPEELEARVENLLKRTTQKV